MDLACQKERLDAPSILKSFVLQLPHFLMPIMAATVLGKRTRGTIDAEGETPHSYAPIFPCRMLIKSPILQRCQSVGQASAGQSHHKSTGRSLFLLHLAEQHVRLQRSPANLQIRKMATSMIKSLRMRPPNTQFVMTRVGRQLKSMPIFVLRS